MTTGTFSEKKLITVTLSKGFKPYLRNQMITPQFPGRSVQRMHMRTADTLSAQCKVDSFAAVFQSVHAQLFLYVFASLAYVCNTTAM